MSRVFLLGGIYLCTLLVSFGANISIGYAVSLVYHSTVQRSDTPVDGLEDPYSVASSPDGNNIYVAGFSDNAVAVFGRNPVTGALTFVQAIKDGDGGIVDGLVGVTCVTVSPDGAYVYATGANGIIAVLVRSPLTGALTFVQVIRSEIGNIIHGLWNPVFVTVSSDGNHVYVAGASGDAVAVFSRNPATGVLALVQDIVNGDAGVVDGLDGARSIAVSPDNNYVYVAGNTDDAIAVFGRDTETGVLTFVQVIKDGDAGNVDGLDGANSVVVSPDNNHVYVTGETDDAIAVFSRDTETGVLTFVQTLKNGDEGTVNGLDYAQSVTVSPDGSHIYVAASTDSIAAFRRDRATGILTFVEFVRNQHGELWDQLDGANSIILSPDGMHLYVTALANDSVAVFERNITSGVLHFTEIQKDGSTTPEGLLSPSAIASSPDNKNIYVTGQNDNSIVTFKRQNDAGALVFSGVKRDGVGGVDGLAFPVSVVVSPNGDYVYVAANVDHAVSVFRRLPGSGNLSFVQVVKDGDIGGVDGLNGAYSVTVSPDSRYVYVAGFGDNAIAVFDADRNSGQLRFVQVIKDSDAGVDGLDGATSVTVSPDNKNVYATGYSDSAVAVFSRNLIYGELTFVQVIKDGEAGSGGLDGATSVTVSPDNKHVYVAGYLGNALAVFSRNAVTGVLSFIEVKSNEGLAGATSITISPDGSYVYVAGNRDDAIAVFNRNPQTGTLNFLEVKRNRAGGVKELEEPSAVLVSPDGNFLFATARRDNAVTLFEISYSAQDLENKASMERQKWDANNDNLIGLEEAIHALQVTSGN